MKCFLWFHDWEKVGLVKNPSYDATKIVKMHSGEVRYLPVDGYAPEMLTEEKCTKCGKERLRDRYGEVNGDPNP